MRIWKISVFDRSDKFVLALIVVSGYFTSIRWDFRRRYRKTLLDDFFQLKRFRAFVSGVVENFFQVCCFFHYYLSHVSEFYGLFLNSTWSLSSIFSIYAIWVYRIHHIWSSSYFSVSSFCCLRSSSTFSLVVFAFVHAEVGASYLINDQPYRTCYFGYL